MSDEPEGVLVYEDEDIYDCENCGEPLSLADIDHCDYKGEP